MPEERDEFGGLAVAEPQADEFGGIEVEGQAPVLSPETLARTAVGIGVGIPQIVNRDLELAAPGAEMAREQSEYDRRLQAARAVAAGGGPVGPMIVPPPRSFGPRTAAESAFSEHPIRSAVNAVLSVPGRVLNAYMRQAAMDPGSGVHPPPPERFGETKEEREQEVNYPMGAPGEPLYIPQSDHPSDVERWASQASTIDDLLALPMGVTRTGGKILLASMIPGIVGQVKDIATGPGDARDKLEKAKDLVIPAAIGIFASRPKGGRLFPQFPTEALDVGTPVAPPLEFTGAALPGRPAGAVPAPKIRPRSDVLVGPPQPPRGLPIEVPATEAGPQPTALEEIRANNAQTTAQVQKLFPQLSREEAAQLRNYVWGKPGESERVGVVVSPTIPRPTPMQPPRPSAIPAPELPIRTPLTGEPSGAELEETQRQKDAIGQQIITWERELDKALKTGDTSLRSQAINKLLALREAYEGPPATAQIRPKPPLPEIGREPRVPETAAEPGREESVLAEIRRNNARTTGEVQRLFPDRKLTREEAADLRRQAWGEKPPEEPPAAGPAAPAEPPPPAPPAATAAAAEVPPVTDFRNAANIPAEQFQDWLDKHGGDLKLPTNAAYAMSDALKTPADVAEAEALLAAERKKIEDLKAQAKAETDPAKKNQMIRQAVSYVSKIQYFDEGIKMAKARNAVAEGMTVDEAARKYGVANNKLASRVPAPAAEPTPEPETAAAPAEEASPAAESTETPKPATLEETPLAGKTLADWEAVKDASQLPKGAARAELAKFLAVPNQPGRILQALANKKRTREIHAPVKPVEEVTQQAPPAAEVPPGQKGGPEEGAPAGELFNVPQTARTGSAARAAIIRRLEELEDIDPATGEAVPKEDLTEAQEKARKKYREMLKDLELEGLGDQQAAERFRKVAEKTQPTAPAEAPPVSKNAPRIAQLRLELAAQQKKLDKNVAKMGTMVPPPIVSEITRKISDRMAKIQDEIDDLEAEDQKAAAPAAEEHPMDKAVSAITGGKKGTTHNDGGWTSPTIKKKDLDALVVAGDKAGFVSNGYMPVKGSKGGIQVDFTPKLTGVPAQIADLERMISRLEFVEENNPEQSKAAAEERLRLTKQVEELKKQTAPPETKPAETATKPPESATKPAEPETKPAASETPQPEDKGAPQRLAEQREQPSMPQRTPELEEMLKRVKESRAKLDEQLAAFEGRKRKSLDIRDKYGVGSPQEVADREAGLKAGEELEAAGKAHGKLEVEFMDKKLKAEFEAGRAARETEPEPSEPQVTSKVLKAQKADLLQQLDQAIKDAPAKKQGVEPGRINLQVEGDGEFNIINTKEALKDFRDKHAAFFPETVGGAQTPKVPTGKGKAVPKVAPPKANDLPKISGLFTSDDPTRYVLTKSYADGTQIIATDGRQLIRIVTNEAPGTPARPVQLTPEGKVDTEAAGNFPNYQAVMPKDPTLMKGGADTGELWKLARQAQIILKDTKSSRMELWLNKDGSLGASADGPGVGTFEHNKQPDAYLMGGYNVDYLLRSMEAARKLGNEKVDIYAEGTTGPIEFVGKNHHDVLMGMRAAEEPGVKGKTEHSADIRGDPEKLLPAQTGQKVHARQAQGLAPFEDYEAERSRRVPIEGGGAWNVRYEDGQFTVSRDVQYSAEHKLPFDKAKDVPPSVADIVAEVGEDQLNAKNAGKVRAAMEELLKERRAVMREGEKRMQGFRPELAGPGSPTYGQGPDPDVVGLELGSPVLSKLQRRYQNLFAGLGQLFQRRGIKRDLQSLSNAASNLPKVTGLRAGDSVRVRTTPQEQNAITAVMQSLKMSGEGLSQESAERLGQLEFAGDPTGYLQSKETDMNTLAQQYKNEGKLLEAHAAAEWARHLKYARENFNRLKPLAEFTKGKFDRQHQHEQVLGIDVAYENWYVPQRYDLDLMPASDRPIVLGDSKGSGPATTFKKAKVYEDYASAIEAGFIPRTFNIADLLEHRVTTGEKLITGRGFFDQMRQIEDPVDGKALVIDIPRRIIHRPDGSVDVQESIPRGYSPQQIMGGTRVAVHDGYGRLVDALTARSQLSQSAIFGTLQDIAAAEKHLMLALDTFHASRTMQAELALTGKVSLGARQRLGRALIEYSPSDLDAAVTKGEITQEMADYIRRPQKMMVNGKEVSLTPATLINAGIRNGLNIARYSDALYREWLRNVPITGAVNKWVFEKLTRSAMAHGFLAEFERIAAAKPEITGNEVAKQVARDINVLFGNLGKESVFRNPSLRSITQVLFLAPQWVEALARREGRAVLQVGESAVRLAQGKPVALGSAAKAVGTGLAAYFAATQVLNLITRGHFTFQNKEQGHKLDAWIPGGKNGYFISPLSVFAEVTHDVLKYAETKPDFATALSQIGANKLGNLGRFLEVVAAGRDPITGEKIVGTGRRAIRAGLQLTPVPIIGSNIGRVAQEGLPAALPSFGIKAEPAGSAQTQIFRMVDDWKLGSENAKYRAEAERRQKEDFGPSDYRELRTALSRNDLRGARQAYQQLRQEGKTPRTIRQTLQHPHPFTGSAAAEARFKASLNQDERELYNKALEERRQLYHKFQQMLATPNQ